MTVDPVVRRETPLALSLKARIRRDGPITVRDYMDCCLNDPEHGYYRGQTAIGAAGDFITAPEISQVFGELLGLLVASAWQGLSEPASLHLIEIGPGRGTLMADVLRVAQRLPRFYAALSVTLAEQNTVLEAEQKARLAGAAARIRWCGGLHEIAADGSPVIVLANEFLDTLPVRQVAGGAECLVGLDQAGQLAFIGTRDAIFETQDFGFLDQLAALSEAAPLAALFIDYGHMTGAPGDTLQAVRGHVSEHPLTSPGEADLTVHVDFEAFAAAARARGFEIDGPIAQADLLGRLGIMERASRLMAANPAKAGAIEMGVARLMAPQGMGSRFKAIGLRRGAMAPLF